LASQLIRISGALYLAVIGRKSERTVGSCLLRSFIIGTNNIKTTSSIRIRWAGHVLRILSI